MSNEFKQAQMQLKLAEVEELAWKAGIDLVYFLGHYGDADGDGKPSMRVSIHEDPVHRLLDIVRDIVLFTPVPFVADANSAYFQELKDLLFKWHNATHTEKLQKEERYEWME